MRATAADRRALEALDFRLRTLLPEEYQDRYETLQPRPMRAAPLKFSADGRVAWDDIWGSFCDLAVAGGPPHKGALLEPASPAAVTAAPDRYLDVVGEICRGITMVTGLPAERSPVPGWIRVACPDPTSVAWLLRAIAFENVAVHGQGTDLFLPASPDFRLPKEIKNVVTVIAKTTHYWSGHMSGLERAAVGRLIGQLDAEARLVAPPWPAVETGLSLDLPTRRSIDRRVFAETGLTTSAHTYPGWMGVECPNVPLAVWVARALVVSNVLSRREGGTVFLPVAPVHDPGGARACQSFSRMHHLATVRSLL